MSNLFVGPAKSTLKLREKGREMREWGEQGGLKRRELEEMGGMGGEGGIVWREEGYL